MMEDTVKIANEAINDKSQVNLIINNRAGGNAPPIDQNIAAQSFIRKSSKGYFYPSFVPVFR
jgi:hypothetical protein